MESRREYNGVETRGKDRVCRICEKHFIMLHANQHRYWCQNCLIEETEGHWVYYIPNEHYVGVSDKPYRRINHHHKKGWNIANARMLFHSKSRSEAERVEAEFHIMLSCNGAVWQNRK